MATPVQTEAASSTPSPSGSVSSGQEPIDVEFQEVAPDSTAPRGAPSGSTSARPLVLRVHPVPRRAASARGSGKKMIECGTCHRKVASTVTARVGPISIPLCDRCAHVAEFGVNLLYKLFR
jgi:hypothetical protein